eukprot:939225-Amphidinium_carterae.1
MDGAILASMVFEQLLNPDWQLDNETFELQARHGNLRVPCDVITDSWSLFQALKPGNNKVPDEKSLVLILAAVREHFQALRARRVGWCRTQEMLADALSKASISREALLRAAATGHFVLRTAVWHS